mgnify:CR=1 FL=1
MRIPVGSWNLGPYVRLRSDPLESKVTANVPPVRNRPCWKDWTASAASVAEKSNAKMDVPDPIEYGFEYFHSDSRYASRSVAGFRIGGLDSCSSSGEHVRFRGLSVHYVLARFRFLRIPQIRI